MSGLRFFDDLMQSAIQAEREAKSLKEAVSNRGKELLAKYDDLAKPECPAAHRGRITGMLGIINEGRAVTHMFLRDVS